MRFNENDICKLMKAVTYYRDMITGSDFMWEQYDHLLSKLKSYGEEVTEKALSCPVE